MLGYLRGRGFPDPEDVCGETFLEVVRGLPRFDGDERGFRSWVLTIAHHRGLDAVRARDRRPADPTSPERLHAAGPSTPAADLSVLADAATDETVALLGCLGEDQREVLLLRLLGGLSAAEIAVVTRRSRDAVKALQKRAIARLRDELGVGHDGTDAVAAVPANTASDGPAPARGHRATAPRRGPPSPRVTPVRPEGR